MNEVEEAEVELRAVFKMRKYLDAWEADLGKIFTIKPGSSSNLHEGEIDALPWRDNPKGFQWVFAKDREGNPIKETDLLIVAISNAPKGKFVLGQWTYSKSPDNRFIQRRKAR